MPLTSALPLFGRFFTKSPRVNAQFRTFKPTTLFSPKPSINHITFRKYAGTIEEALSSERITKIRNIGISAHIDSGKTTLTERILYYTGRIDEIHEVRGKDGVGAKMDSMDLEREKGITIQSAATYTQWRDHHINIIDTPGHVDFTIEVERALRVLDGAVLVICAVGSVQSQTMTVDRQMSRYKVPRICFINKLDRNGADPWRAITEMRQKLETSFAAVQVPVGLEDVFEGLIDLIDMSAHFYDGDKGSNVRSEPIPEKFLEFAKEKQQELIMAVADVDDEFAELILSQEDYTPTPEELRTAIKRATVARKFSPVFMGSAYKNKGVQQLLDGVLTLLPNPHEVTNVAINTLTNEDVELSTDTKAPFVGYAFKLEEGRFGQLTYLRIYQGVLSRGGVIFNTKSNEKLKVPRLVRMHANEMEEIYHIGAGEICALFGVDCHTGTTFTDGTVNYSMTAMFVPDPVMSLSISMPKGKQDPNFHKSLAKFEKEDPTFRNSFDSESNQHIISGMGELHLEIYIERMKREYGLQVVVGKPQVAFREGIQKRVEFNYVHKKQSGGRGQYAKIIGYIEPITDASDDFGGRTMKCEFVDDTVGGSVPPEFVPAVEKGMEDALLKGPLVGHKVCGLRFVLTDGGFHPVDSSELAFRLAAKYACHSSIIQANPVVLEPIMKVEVITPSEFQSSIVGNLNRRKGIIMEANNGLQYYSVSVSVPLNNMFGYSTELRSTTQGKGEFSMEYLNHQVCAREVQDQLAAAYAKVKQSGEE